MTKDEIVAALRCCVSVDPDCCKTCPAVQEDGCEDAIKVYSTDLIKNQQREIEALQKRLEMSNAERDANTKRMIELEQGKSGVERLAAYEYTGLTPEEICKVRADIDAGYMKSIARTYGIDITRMKEIAKADREGRVVVLPCKVGDKLYRVFDGNISEHEVQNMKYFARQRRLGIDMTPFFPDAGRFIGKTVFLTREEAKEALRRAENG